MLFFILTKLGVGLICRWINTMNRKERQTFRRLRKTLRLSQAWIAKQAGISQSRVSGWEMGRVELTPDEEDRIGEAIEAVVIKRGIPGQVTPEQAAEDLRKGTILSRLREEYGVTQAELAEKAEINQSTVSGFERGNVDLSPTQVEQLFKAFNDLLAERAAKASTSTLASLRSPRDPRAVERDKIRQDPAFQLEVAHEAGKELWNKNAELRKQLAYLQEKVRLFDELIASYKKRVSTDDELIAAYQEALEKTGSEKDAQIAELEKKVEELRTLYEAGTEAALAHAKFEELRAKVSVPDIEDNEPSPENPDKQF
jgi:transcriptional regulator with XRE-family HTH domain